MCPQIAFRKVTPDGLSVIVEEFGGLRLLLLTKDLPGKPARPVQVLGVAGVDTSTSAVTWRVEYEPMESEDWTPNLTKWLSKRGYLVGMFDQYGNFRDQRVA